MNKNRSLASYACKLLCLFCREKFCEKTDYSGIELICEFAEKMPYHNQNLFLIVSCCFFDVYARLAILQRFFKGKSGAYE